MNARRVSFEAPKERSRVCFGGFRPTKHVGLYFSLYYKNNTMEILEKG
jgi:hypothetical protein